MDLEKIKVRASLPGEGRVNNEVRIAALREQYRGVLDVLSALRNLCTRTRLGEIVVDKTDDKHPRGPGKITVVLEKTTPQDGPKKQVTTVTARFCPKSADGFTSTLVTEEYEDHSVAELGSPNRLLLPGFDDAEAANFVIQGLETIKMLNEAIARPDLNPELSALARAFER